MKNFTFKIQYPGRTTVILSGFVLIIVLFCGCHTTKPQFYVSQYIFNYEGDKYRIRTISTEDHKKSYNELIGKNFVAADYDQDGIIDQVVMGDTELPKVQEIYDYSLTQLTRENKLRETSPDIRQYYQQNDNLVYEIISFRPVNSEPFNEFKITDKRSTYPAISIYTDLQADGKLDDTLKGPSLTAEIQAKYAEVLDSGLQENKIEKINHSILVKEK